MFALAAAVVFGIAFLINLAQVEFPARISLLLLGLTLLAVNFATPLPGRQRRR